MRGQAMRRLWPATLAQLLVTLGVRRHSSARRNTLPQTGESQCKPGAKAIVVELYRRITNDRVMAISAGVTYYALLAIFPAIAALVSICGLFVDPRTFNADLSSLSRILPGGAIQVVTDQVKYVAANGHNALGLAALGGIAFSLWSANSGVKSLFDALNIVLRERERRGFVQLNAVSLAFTFAALLFALLAIVVVIGVPAFLSRIGLNATEQEIVAVARWPAIWLCVALAIAALYRFGPGRNDIPWQWLSWGSAFASIVWLAASFAFSFYAANFGTYNRTYGSLGAVVGFMVWIWISVTIILIGEELNEILDKRDSPDKAASQTHPFARRAG